jgi:hypothetical protein
VSAVIEPVVDIIIGLFLRVIIWCVVTTVRFVVRTAWSLLTDHPGLSFLMATVALNEGWWSSPWAPYALLGLGALAVARLFSVHPPSELRDRALGAHRSTVRHLARASATGEMARETFGKVGDRARRVFRRDKHELPAMPAPPRPVATERTADVFGDPLDDAGRRLFAYRDAGYGGWLDQDGHPVDEHGTRITATGPDGAPIVADVDAVIPLGPVAERAG